MNFILTNELGRLAKWLRILGFDALYFKPRNYSELIIESLRQERIIVTRDTKLSPTEGVRLIRIRYDGVRDQLKQLADELNLDIENADLFSVCVVCNKKLIAMDKEQTKGKVPEYVYNTQKDFVICPACKRIYWQGTHWGNVRKLLEEVK